MILIILDHAQALLRKKIYLLLQNTNQCIIQFEIKKWNKINNIVGRRKSCEIIIFFKQHFKMIDVMIKSDYTSFNLNNVKQLLLSYIVEINFSTITSICPTLWTIVIIFRWTEKLAIFIPTFFNNSLKKTSNYLNSIIIMNI